MPSALTGAISEALRRIDTAVALEPVPQDPAATGTDPVDAAARAATEAVAARVFGSTTGTRTTDRVIIGTRPPTADERRAARQVLVSVVALVAVFSKSASRRRAALDVLRLLLPRRRPPDSDGPPPSRAVPTDQS